MFAYGKDRINKQFIKISEDEYIDDETEVLIKKRKAELVKLFRNNEKFRDELINFL